MNEAMVGFLVLFAITIIILQPGTWVDWTFEGIVLVSYWVAVKFWIL